MYYLTFIFDKFVIRSLIYIERKKKLDLNPKENTLYDPRIILSGLKMGWLGPFKLWVGSGKPMGQMSLPVFFFFFFFSIKQIPNQRDKSRTIQNWQFTSHSHSVISSHASLYIMPLLKKKKKKKTLNLNVWNVIVFVSTF